MATTLPVIRILIAAVTSVASAAWAVEQATGTIEEVVVYSQKRAESSQDVPVAVTPITAENLEDTFSVDLTDIGFQAPNVQLQAVSTFPGFANFTMRGIGVSTSIRTLDPAVNIFVDGMVLGTQIGAVLDVFDVEVVEVLRGPQGVFFGRNSTGGAVSLRTAKPTEEFNASINVAAGSFDLIEFEGIVQGALSDVVRAKLAVQYRRMDGVFEDDNEGTFVPATYNPSGLQPGNVMRDQSEQDSIFIKPTITFEPSDTFELTLFGQYYKDEGGGSATKAFIDEDFNANPPLLSLYGYTPPDGQFNINHDLLGESETETFHIIAEANWDVGPGTLTSVTGYRDLSFDSSLDVDGTPFLLIHFPNNEEEASQFTQEIRYAFDVNNQLDLLIGGFFMDSEMEVIERREFTGLTAGRDHFDYNYIQADWKQEQTSVAVFANARYALSDAWTLSAGLRYTSEEKEISIAPLGQCTGPQFSGCPSAKTDLKEDWNNASPRVALEFRPNANTLIYGSWTRGFRSGNFNARAGGPAIGPADPEQADQFEIGLKGDFADGTLRANLTGFVTVYDDIQRVTNTQTETGQPLQLLNNAAKATIPGIEAELYWYPTEALSLQASIGWVDPQYDEFTGLDLNGDGEFTSVDDDLAEDLKFERAPEITLFFAGEYRLNLGDLPGDVILRAQYAWRDEYFTDIANLESRLIDSFGIFDASVRYETDRLRVAVYGRNLGKSNYADIISTAFNQQSFGGQRRTFGVELGYSL